MTTDIVWKIKCVTSLKNLRIQITRLVTGTTGSTISIYNNGIVEMRCDCLRAYLSDFLSIC